MSASVVTITETGVVQVQTPATQVVTIVGEGPRGATGPLGDWLGAIYINDKPSSGEVVLDIVPGENLTLDSNLDGWTVRSRVAATAETVVRVLVGDIEKGTITWGAGDTSPTLATDGGAEVPVPSTDYFTIQFPAPADLTLARISICVRARRA